MIPAALAGCLVPLAPDPAALVLKLADPDYRVRDRADKSLDALGLAAYPALAAAAANSLDAELRTRAAVLLGRIGRRTESQRAGAATLVQLRFENVPLAVLLLELERQTGCLFWGRYDEAWVPAVTVSYTTRGPEAFWDVLDAVGRQTGLEPSSFRPQVTLPPPVPGAARNPQPVPFVRLVSTELEARAKAEREAMEKAAADKLTAAKKNLEAFEAFAKAIEARAQKAVPVPQPAPVPPGVFAQPPFPINRNVAASVLPDARAVYLTKRNGPAPVAVTAGATRIEFETVGLGAGGGVAAFLRVMPEPRFKLERISSVRVTKALGQGGELLTANLKGWTNEPPTTAATARIRVLNAQLDSSYVRMPQHTGLRVMIPFVGRDDFTGFAEIAGVLSGHARGPIAELIRLPDLETGKTAEAAGPAHTRLVAALGEQEIDGGYPLTVTMAYSMNSGLTFAGPADTAAVAAAAGLQGPVPAATNVGYGQVYTGLFLTDAAGKPFAIRVSAISASSMIRDGDRIYSRTMKMIAAPTATDQGPPVHFGLYASTLRPVEIPFRLTGLK